MNEPGKSSWISELRTMILALIVTALIWIWAEGQSLTGRSVTVRVALPVSAASDLLMESPQLEDSSLGAVLRFEGSTLSVDAARELQGKTIDLDPGSPGLPGSPGDNQIIDLRRALAARPEIAKLNLPLVRVEPETLIVHVSRLSTKDLPVRVELAREVSLSGEPVPLTKKVRVRVPEALASRIPADAQVVAVVSEDQLLNLKGEGQETVSGTCRLPPSLDEIRPVRFVPETVNILLRVRQAWETYRLPEPIPVLLMLPTDENLRDWKISVLDAALPDVAVSGPPEQIARIARSLSGIRGVIEITREDLARVHDQRQNAGVDEAAGTLNLSKSVLVLGLPGNVAPVGQLTARVRVSRADPRSDSPNGQLPAPDEVSPNR